MSDPQKYRTKDEVAEFQERDPIQHCAKVLQDNKWMTEAQLKEVDKEIKAIVSSMRDELSARCRSLETTYSAELVWERATRGPPDAYTDVM